MIHKFIGKIPKEKRPKPNLNEGVLDELGFFKTPNGSFWDPDDEYFNRHGFDIHAGCYSNDLEYIPGPEWLPELGCYPEDKEKYLNMKYEEIDDDMDNNEDFIEDEFKGDFEDDNMDDNYDILQEDLKKLEIDDKKLIEKYLGGDMLGLNLNINIPNSNSKTVQAKKKKKNNKKPTNKEKKKQDDSDGWETLEEDDEI